MKISYNWLKTLIDIELSPEELGVLLTNCGLEVEGIEAVSSIQGGLQGLVIGEVKERWQHPNADRLSVTKVDVGGPELLQIVCGAPNVAAGQKVLVATVGATLYPTGGEPFKISKSKIRGEVSEGMICAEDEVGLGTSHDGIMVLDAAVVVGSQGADYFKVENDFTIEIGLTANRGDAASHLGVARDVAALTGKKVNVKYAPLPAQQGSNLVEVVIEDTEGCPRYSGISISGVEVKPSPAWLQNRLKAIGLSPINNIVDVTNFVLHELGQPIHAFDADKITGNKIVVKKAAQGQKFTTLDKTERTLTGNELLICNAAEPMAIAGVFGGLHSGVSAETKNLFIESAYFDPGTIRKSAKGQGLNTDASFRYERGTDPEITVNAINRVVELILATAGGSVSSPVVDVYARKINPSKITLRYKKLNEVLGQTASVDEVKAIITGLDITVEGEDENGLQLSVPAYRPDVTREIDVIEEFIRIYGLNKIEIPLSVKLSYNTSTGINKEKLYNRAADMLAANGYYELVTNSLTKVSYYTEEELQQAVRMLNPLSADLEVMRLNTLYSGLEAVAYNRNRKANNLKFFELSKTYRKVEGKYEEKWWLSLWLCGDEQNESWKYPTRTSDFYTLKQTCDNLFTAMGVEVPFTERNIIGSPAEIDGNKLVNYGPVSPKITKSFDIQGTVFYAVIDWERLLQKATAQKFTLKEISKFPEVRRDLSLVIDKKITFEQLHTIARQAERKLLRAIDVFDVYEGDKIEAGKKAYALSFILQDETKTLTDAEIEKIMNRLMQGFEKEVGAVIRK
ncbi:phenylalanine--tRNA ligase subunit beta [Oscillatoria amoena NRMC-F 0135]|nr:phenylalanine--tRNA ligase subunit beta [Oscillatoria amoena NRMC-F 0135]